MQATPRYVARIPDSHGYVNYTTEENSVWHDLYTRQIKIVQNRGCDDYLKGLQILKMSAEHIPQAAEMNAALKRASNFSVHHVAAIIPFDEFFTLLSERQFPAASFIRRREHFDYIEEPDIFHEYFGHCPMLTRRDYADFMVEYGRLAKTASAEDQILLARLYWLTVEFGLINTDKGLRIYGGGILSSPEETIYAVDSEIPERKPFDALEALRTPYRIDIKQPIYFVIDSYTQLYDLLNDDLLDLVQQAKKLGDYPPRYPVK